MRYLERHAEPETRLASALPGGPWDEVVVIPVLRESELLEGLLQSLSDSATASGKRVIAVLVVNHRAGAPQTDKDDNLGLLARHANECAPGLGLSSWGALTCAWLDRATIGRELGEKDGVGTARKIGCDFAVALKNAGRLHCAFGSTTDGDARVDSAYFTGGAVGAPAGLGETPTAFVHRFRHEVSERPEDLPLTLYEIYLRHYVLGLRSARSPYAFHTVGSLIRFGFASYCETRGFPKREAGEDFYLLDKLAKIGRVSDHSGTVRLVPRPSDRVPFGTGAAMARLGTELRRGKVFQLFPDSAFRAVGVLQKALAELSPADTVERWKAYFAGEAVPAGGIAAAEQLGLFRMVDEAARTRKDGANFRRHLQTSFGALKTFQWIRALAALDGETEFREGLRRSAFVGCEVSESESPLSLLEKVRRLDET